jgi:hypothetical protein
MAKVFRPSTRESSILSKIESGKEHARKNAISAVKEHIEALANAISMKLIENRFVETLSKNSLQEQIYQCLDRMTQADDFQIDYQCASVRGIVAHPNIVSLYVTAFIIEQLIQHKDVIDIFGSDEDIYQCVHQQVNRFLPA